MDARDAPPERQPTEDSTQSSVLLLSSTVTRGRYHQCGSGRRVKLYVLEGAAWADRGTGYCAGVYDEKQDEALIVARKEESCTNLGRIADADDDAPAKYMLVVSETLDTSDILLCAPVVKDDVYQRQQDTLVVWTAPDGSDLALSFQEPEGCNEVWDFLSEVQHHFMLSRAGAYGEHELSDDVEDAEPFSMPAPDTHNLAQIEGALRDASGRGPAVRERIVEWLLREDYVRKLVPFFADAEATGALDVLHALHGVVRALLSVNDHIVIEYLLHDDVFFPALGMLEYNPAYPTLKASYRRYLQHDAQYHPVVDFDDPSMLTKIVETYRLIYLRDVVLAGIVDDAVLAMLNSLVFFYQNDIVSFCVGNEQLLGQLLDIFEGSDAARKGKAVLFLQHLCAMARQIQMPGRISLFRSLVDWGLLRVVEYALPLRDACVRNAAAEILMSMIEFDASCVRGYALEGPQPGAAPHGAPLVPQLTDLLLERGGDAGLRAQATEALRTLFDVCGESTHAKATEIHFLTWLYAGEMQRLMRPLLELPALGDLAPDALLPRGAVPDVALYVHLCELLCLAIVQHSFRSQYYVLSTHLMQHVGALLHAREKPLCLAALHVFRACLERNNEQTHDALVSADAFAHLLARLEREAARDNLVSSACLGFFEQLRRDSARALVRHLCTRHGEAVQRLAKHPVTRACFAALLAQHERGASAPRSRVEASDASVAAQSAAAEADYFDSEDASGPLVPYEDDGDDAAAPADHEDAAASAGAAPSAPQRSPDAALVPQRRARDEDDDLAEQIAKRTSAEGAARRAPKLEVRVSAQTRRMAAGDEPT